MQPTALSHVPPAVNLIRSDLDTAVVFCFLPHLSLNGSSRVPIVICSEFSC